MNDQYYVTPKKLIEDIEGKVLEINDLVLELKNGYCIGVKQTPFPRVSVDYCEPIRPTCNLDDIF